MDKHLIYGLDLSILCLQSSLGCGCRCRSQVLAVVVSVATSSFFWVGRLASKAHDFDVQGNFWSLLPPLISRFDRVETVNHQDVFTKPGIMDGNI